jgi:hypothetical protein
MIIPTRTLPPDVRQTMTSALGLERVNSAVRDLKKKGARGHIYLNKFRIRIVSAKLCTTIRRFYNTYHELTFVNNLYLILMII